MAEKKVYINDLPPPSLPLPFCTPRVRPCLPASFITFLAEDISWKWLLVIWAEKVFGGVS